jgi:hypothetical protein
MGASPLYARCGVCGAEFDVAAWRDGAGRIEELEAFAAAHAACDPREFTVQGSSLAADG